MLDLFLQVCAPNDCNAGRKLQELIDIEMASLIEGDEHDASLSEQEWRSRIVQASSIGWDKFLNGSHDSEPFDINSAFLTTGATAGIGASIAESRVNGGEARPKIRPRYEENPKETLKVEYSEGAENVWREKELTAESWSPPASLEVVFREDNDNDDAFEDKHFSGRDQLRVEVEEDDNQGLEEIDVGVGDVQTISPDRKLLSVFEACTSGAINRPSSDTGASVVFFQPGTGWRGGVRKRDSSGKMLTEVQCLSGSGTETLNVRFVHASYMHKRTIHGDADYKKGVPWFMHKAKNFSEPKRVGKTQPARTFTTVDIAAALERSVLTVDGDGTCFLNSCPPRSIPRVPGANSAEVTYYSNRMIVELEKMITTYEQMGRGEKAQYNEMLISQARKTNTRLMIDGALLTDSTPLFKHMYDDYYTLQQDDANAFVNMRRWYVECYQKNCSLLSVTANVLGEDDITRGIEKIEAVFYLCADPFFISPMGGNTQKDYEGGVFVIEINGHAMKGTFAERLIYLLHTDTLDTAKDGIAVTVKSALERKIKMHTEFLKAAEIEHARRTSGGNCNDEDCRCVGQPKSDHHHTFSAKHWIGDQTDLIMIALLCTKAILVINGDGNKTTLTTSKCEDGSLRPSARLYMPNPSALGVDENCDQLYYNGHVYIATKGLRFKGTHEFPNGSVPIDIAVDPALVYVMFHFGDHYGALQKPDLVKPTKKSRAADLAAKARVKQMQREKREKKAKKKETKKGRKGGGKGGAKANVSGPKKASKKRSAEDEDDLFSTSPLLQCFAKQRNAKQRKLSSAKPSSANNPKYVPNPILTWDYNVLGFDAVTLFGLPSQNSRNVMSVSDVKREAVNHWNTNGAFLVQGGDGSFYEAHLKKVKNELTEKFVWKAGCTNIAGGEDPAPEIGSANLYGGIHMEVKERFARYTLPINPQGAPVLIRDGDRWELAHHARTDGEEMETVLVFKDLEDGESFESTYQRMERSKRILTDAITASSTSSDSTNRSRQLPTSSQNLAASGTSVSSETDMFQAAFQVSDSD